MTVSTTASRVEYTGNGMTTTFDFAFRVLTKAHLAVTLYDSLTGVETAVATSAFNVTTLPANSGTVTYPISGTPIPATTNLIIQRVVPLSQLVDINNQTGFDANVTEEAFDLGTMADQQLNEQVSRSLRFPVSDAGIGELPAALGRASRFLYFDANGDVNLNASPTAEAQSAANAAVAASAASLWYQSRAAVQGFSIPSAYKSLRTAAYATANDGGGGLYYRVDSEPAHEGKVRTLDRFISDGTADAVNGGWWELAEEIDGINVCAVGADRTGGSNTTAAVQNALAISSRIYFPAGDYNISSAIGLSGNFVRVYGPHAKLNSTSAAGLFKLGQGGNLLDFTIELDQIRGSAGHLFEVVGTTSRGSVKVRYINTPSGYSALTNGGGVMYHCTFRVQFWDAFASSTVPVVNWVEIGSTFNANRFEVQRCDGVSVPWCVIDSTDANRQKGLVFEGFQLELCDAGWLKLGGVAHVTIKDVTSFDNGTITAPLVELADGSGGAKNNNVKISRLWRTTGTLSGTSDIKLTGTTMRGVIIEGCGAESVGAGFTVDVNANTRTSIRDSISTTVLNQPLAGHLVATYRDWDGKISGVTTPALIIGQGTAAADRQIISGGVITYDGRSGIMLDTEAAAATDDLDTIDATDAPNGTIVFLSTFVDARDVVVKHNTGNIILKAGADTTLATRSQLVTLRYSSLVSKWVEV